jgi:hypothetical protein
VFDPGLGHVRAGFFFSRYGFNFRAIGTTSLIGRCPLKPRKNKQREKSPAPGCGTYSRWRTRVKEKQARNEPNMRDLAHYRSFAGWV